MVVTVDQKRRVVLPKSVRPGDAVDIAVAGERLILQVLRKPVAVPPVAERMLDLSSRGSADIDEPAFMPLTDESLA